VNSKRDNRSQAFSGLACFVVVGAFVLGVLPSPGGGLVLFAQSRKAGADAGVSAKAAAPGKVSMAPLHAFLRRSRVLHQQGKLDLSKPRAITVEGDRREDGTLSNVQITGDSASDPNFRRAAQDFVTALNESRALQLLETVSHVRMTFALDASRFTVQSTHDTPSEARAEEMARGYRVMVNLGRVAKRGTDEGALLGGLKISSSGKQLLMNLDMPREQMGNILHRQITPN
jgi:hypothetical protein